MANLRAWLEFAPSRNPDAFSSHFHPAGRAFASSADSRENPEPRPRRKPALPSKISPIFIPIVARERAP
ncbi:hypothetical protein SBA3_1760018 [Candidatus Sulfopaludibacter sp. SbA3]|nr:hypothetical protein SBA3_1760018 [Candidatus Sulfopaludibacter sp. SbA3]